MTSHATRSLPLFDQPVSFVQVTPALKPGVQPGRPGNGPEDVYYRDYRRFAIVLRRWQPYYQPELGSGLSGNYLTAGSAKSVIRRNRESQVNL